jgi:hypothetical protein
MGPLLTLNLDGTKRRVHSDLWRIWLLPGEPEPGVVIRVQIDPEAAIRWEELDRLPELVELQYSGRDARLPKYLAARPGITRLSWSGHRQIQLDLSRTHLAELSFDGGTEPLAVRLPLSGTLQRLAFAAHPDPAALRIHAPEAGAGIYLMQGCQDLTGAPSAVPGLERLRALSVFNVKEVRLERLLPYRELEELAIIGPPGAIAGLEVLASFPKLRHVTLRECYELDAAALPLASAFPALERVEIDGIRRTDATLFAQCLAGLPHLSIRGKRTDAWLRANLQNAFREWPDEHGSTVGKAAMAAYRQATLALDRAPADAEAIRVALQAFLAALSRVSAHYPFDTLQREQAADAFDELAARVADAVPLATARAWFDEWEEL